MICILLFSNLTSYLVCFYYNTDFEETDVEKANIVAIATVTTIIADGETDAGEASGADLNDTFQDDEGDVEKEMKLNNFGETYIVV